MLHRGLGLALCPHQVTGTRISQSESSYISYLMQTERSNPQQRGQEVVSVPLQNCKTDTITNSTNAADVLKRGFSLFSCYLLFFFCFSSLSSSLSLYDDSFLHVAYSESLDWPGLWRAR